MSVNSQYLSVEWSRLSSRFKDEDFVEYLLEAYDRNAKWLGDVQFGKQIDPYYFQSWHGLIAFNDWFRNIRKKMNPEFVKDFAAVFKDAGLLYKDKTYGFHPIKKGFDFEDDWLLASIPPEDVRELLERVQRLDLKQTEVEFQSAIEKVPCDMVPDGATIAQWVEALKDGLSAVVAQGRGIIMGAA